MRVDFILLYRFGGEEEEDPDAGADGRAVEVEDVAFEEGVEGAGDVAEGAGEEEDGYYRAVVAFEAFE